ISRLVSMTAGLSPRIAITSAGESWIVWGEPGSPGRLRYVWRNPATGLFSPVGSIGVPTESSRNPEIVHDGQATLVAYEIVGGSDRSVAVTGITDSPEPFPQRT